MSPSVSEKSQLMEQAIAMIEERGGVAAMRERMDEFHQCVVRMDNERAALLEKHPDKWVAMGKDGLLAVGSSIDDVLVEIDDRGMRDAEMLIEFLDTNPPVLIL